MKRLSEIFPKAKGGFDPDILSIRLNKAERTLHITLSKAPESDWLAKFTAQTKAEMNLSDVCVTPPATEEPKPKFVPPKTRPSVAGGRVDNAPKKRVELHLHTKMSEKDAVSSAEELIKAAADWGHPAIAITDHGVCHAFPKAYKAGKAHGIKVLYGVEGYLKVEQENYHIILLAKTQIGMKNLYKLVSASHTEHFYRRPRLTKELISQHREGLIIGAGCEAGEVFSAIVNNLPLERQIELAEFYDYLEIQPVANNRFLIRRGRAKDFDTLKDWNRAIVELAKKLDIPVCATCDAHFLNPEDEDFRAVLLSSMNMLDPDPLPLFLRTTEEMLEEFSYLGEELAYKAVVENPRKINEMCESLRPLPEGEYFPKIEGSAESLRESAYAKAREMYGSPLPENIAEQLEKELEAIIRGGYDIIYTISQKLVHRSVENGYLVGSRGSVGSSIAAYFAGITEVCALPPHYRCPACKYSEFTVDTVKYPCGFDLPAKACPNCDNDLEKDGFDIPFATFLGFDASKKPDIDLNFSGDYHERAIAHVSELFGDEKVFRAGTFNTLRDRNAAGYVRKYMEDNSLSLSEDEQARLVKGLLGVKITTGQHPGGMMILPDDMEIYDFCPLHRAANRKDGTICTHFDYHDIEETLVKLDILGHDGPTYIRRLEELTDINSLKNPLNDPNTMSIFRSTSALGFAKDSLLGAIGTAGIPEYGTRFVRGMLKKAKPRTFDELVRIAGLSHGENVWLENAEALIASGVATLREVVSARDDITNNLRAKGLPGKLSLDISESVRKGRGLKPEWIDAMRDAGVTDWYIDSCNAIKYLFPKAHAAAYAMMSFRIAWFKVHKPEAFYAVYFTLKIDDFDYFYCTKDNETIRELIQTGRRRRDLSAKDKTKLAVLEVAYEMRLRGITFAPLDVHTSDPLRFSIAGEGEISVPLMAIPGLGGAAATSIAAERVNGVFIAEDNILARCRPVTKAHIESLRNAGALKGLPELMQTTLF